MLAYSNIFVALKWAINLLFTSNSVSDETIREPTALNKHFFFHFVKIAFCSISYEIAKFDKLHCTLHIVIIATFECACWGEYIDLKDQLECWIINFKVNKFKKKCIAARHTMLCYKWNNNSIVGVYVSQLLGQCFVVFVWNRESHGCIWANMIDLHSKNWFEMFAWASKTFKILFFLS